MRIITICLILLLAGLQYKLWIGDGGVMPWRHMNRKLMAERKLNEELALQNDIIAAEVVRLQEEGADALEDKARFELGMIKQDEVYYHFVD